MNARWIRAVQLRFDGGRYDECALDAAALGEIQRFQRLVARTAEAFWRRQTPDRRPPRGFGERTALCLRGIEAGSTLVSLDGPREALPLFTALGRELPAELTRATDCIHNVFRSACEGAGMPDETPTDLLPEYARLGGALPESETLAIVPREGPEARVTKEGRERLRALAGASCEETVEATGCVLEADVRRKRFQLWIDKRDKVTVGFSEEQEHEVVTALKEHATMRVRVRGPAALGPDGKPRRIARAELLESAREGAPLFDSDARPGEKKIARMSPDIAAYCRAKGIVKLAAFVSTLRPDYGPASDVGLLVDFAPERAVSLLGLAGIQTELSELFGLNVNLVERGGVEESRNPLWREAILGSAETVYEA